MKKHLNVLGFKKAGANAFLLFCFLAAGYLAFFHLGTSPFDNWDEAWYAEAVKQMLRTKEFVVLYWNHSVWLDKPPMYMWLSAGVSSVIGLSEFSVRFTSALSGFMVIMIVTWYSQKKFGIVPAFLAFSTLALNNIFIWRLRSGNIDVFATLLILLTYFVLIGKNKYKYALLGLLFAFIFLTKASLVLYPLIIFILNEIIFERKKILLHTREYLKLFAVFIFLPALWLFLGYLRVGSAFPLYYLLTSDQGVGSINLSNFNTNYIMHAYYSLQRRFFCVLLIGVFFALRNIKDSKIFILLLYAVALLIQLSFTQKDNNWYLIPSMPFWSILIAYGTYQVIGVFRKNIVVVGLILALSVYVSYRTFTINIVPILDSSSTVKQAQSSKALGRLTKNDEIVVRLDHLYPVTVYYSDRKVLASPQGTVDTQKNWISRSDLIKAMQQKKIQWFIGKNTEVESFQKQAGSLKFKLIRENDEETIGQVL